MYHVALVEQIAMLVVNYLMNSNTGISTSQIDVHWCDSWLDSCELLGPVSPRLVVSTQSCARCGVRPLNVIGEEGKSVVVVTPIVRVVQRPYRVLTS